MSKDTYRTSQLSNILGISRDALRYYEKKGIVKPIKIRQIIIDSMITTIYTLLVADFYKKRNLSMKEVKNYKKAEQ
ncbi:MerR family transcriptional regulator [Gracilibacillus saliphilus]|uniref:MerR family transcriptional regulator n=1 Tax=Gracilibacillus saliphilus TaxID=543890 RepID=UPI0013D6A867|nr:MerR family DNA-binding transcriptional regulator [Gracilibacillus saliphilus]